MKRHNLNICSLQYSVMGYNESGTNNNHMDKNVPGGRMKDLMSLTEKIIPEAMNLLVQRYNILRSINHNEPIGRRGLSKNLSLSERTVRSETDFLNGQGLIYIHATGMGMTEDGRLMLEALSDVMKDILNLEDLSDIIKDHCGFRKVYISSGTPEDMSYTEEIGKMAGEYLLTVLRRNSTVAVTGGTTVKAMVDMVSSRKTFPDVLVVPARGGMGRNYEIQSNTLAEKLAKKLSCSYRLLNLPDNLSDAARRAMMKETEVAETVTKIRDADIVVAGIGRADFMAKRRSLREEEVRELERKGAVGEFFGSYYNKKKKAVKQNKAVGMSLKDVRNSSEVIVLSGGAEKAEAILSIDLEGLDAVLFTDESCARRMIEIIDRSHSNDEINKKIVEE